MLAAKRLNALDAQDASLTAQTDDWLHAGLTRQYLRSSLQQSNKPPNLALNDEDMAAIETALRRILRLAL